MIYRICGVVTSNNKGSDAEGVYAIAGASYDNTLGQSLIKYDVELGNVSTIVPINYPNLNQLFTDSGLGCFDAINSIYYFMFEAFINSSFIVTLYPYDLSQNSSLDLIFLHMIWASEGGYSDRGDSCVGDPNTGDIYIFGHHKENLAQQILVRMRRDNDNVAFEIVGKYLNIDDAPLSDTWVPMIYDNKRDMIWVAGNKYAQNYFSYYYINATNGTLVNTVNLNEAWPIQIADYHPGLDALVGIYSNVTTQAFNFRHVDPVSLNVIKEFPDLKLYNGSISDVCGESIQYAMDIVHNIWYQIFYYRDPGLDCNSLPLWGHLVGIDIMEGVIVSNVQICSADFFNLAYVCPWEMQYWMGPN